MSHNFWDVQPLNKTKGEYEFKKIKPKNFTVYHC